MIKRIRFATRKPGTSPEVFAERWRDAVAGIVDAPREATPARVALCTTLADVDGSDAKHDGICLEWFDDPDHVERFQTWLETGDGRAHAQGIDELLVPGASPLVLADELVMRGAEWLERRWRVGGDMIKHMAVARRARGLSPAEFSERWKRRAGQVRRAGEDAVTVIPDEARGLAYVQNHPRPRAAGEWAYDALNEVYFDDLAGLQKRIDWFRAHVRDGTEEDLVREHGFIAAREQVVLDAGRGR